MSLMARSYWTSALPPGKLRREAGMSTVTTILQSSPFPSRTSILPPPPPPNLPDHIHQPQKHRHLDQRPHRTRERLVAIGPKRRHRHRDRQFEIVARGRETLRRRHPVPEPQPVHHEQGEEEHDAEIHHQGRGDADYGDDLVHDAMALGREEHEDGKEETDQGPRVQILQKGPIEPVRARSPPERQPRHDGRAERDAQEDGHARRDRRVRHLLRLARPADDVDEQHGQRRIQHHLQQGIERHEQGAELGVAAREARPDEHHGDAAREPHEHQPLPQPLLVGQERPREREHEEGGEDPVQEDGHGDLGPDGPVGEGEVEGFEAHFAEDGVHHGEEAEGDGEGDAGEAALLEGGARAGDEGAEEDAGGHGEEDPEGEEAVEEAEGAEGGELGGGGRWWLGGLFFEV